MFLKNIRFFSNGIAILSHLLTHLNPSSSENVLPAISEITSLDMGLGNTSIYYMYRVRGISQRLQGVLAEKVIPLFSIVILDHNRYPSVKRRYLEGDPALVNGNPLDLSGLLYSKETRHQALGLPSSKPQAKTNRV